MSGRLGYLAGFGFPGASDFQEAIAFNPGANPQLAGHHQHGGVEEVGAFLKAQQPLPKFFVEGIVFLEMLQGIEGCRAGKGPANSNGESSFDGSIHLSVSPLVATTLPDRWTTRGIG